MRIQHNMERYTLIGESFANKTFANFTNYGQKIISANFQIYNPGQSIWNNKMKFSKTAQKKRKIWYLFLSVFNCYCQRETGRCAVCPAKFEISSKIF